MQASDLIEVLCAAHLSHHVRSPYSQRGGIMLVGAPGALKTTFVEILDKNYHDTVMMSDVNAKTLVLLRDGLTAGGLSTLILPEYGKIYERAPETAANVEGILRALVAEGFTQASFEDQRVNKLKAQALLIGAMTPALQQKRFTDWEETGFNRRFLWSLYRLEDPESLMRAVMDWRLMEFNVGRIPQPPPQGKIPMTVTVAERAKIRSWIKYQPGGSHTQHYQLMCKILSVLRWWYKEARITRSPVHTLGAFAQSLSREGALLQFPKQRKRGK